MKLYAEMTEPERLALRNSIQDAIEGLLPEDVIYTLIMQCFDCAADGTIDTNIDKRHIDCLPYLRSLLTNAVEAVDDVVRSN